ncbi:MAG TPA: hypothetical protein PKV98_04290 [Burkholderiaceae bacterium]|nr:hypothetical protein [Burkholderiaceae bacterium]
MDQPSVDVLRVEVRHVRESITEMRDMLKSINSAVQALVRVEQQQVEQRESIDRAHKGIEDQNERLMVLERAHPSLLMTRNWVLAAVVAVFTFSFWAIGTGHLLIAQVPK